LHFGASGNKADARPQNVTFIHYQAGAIGSASQYETKNAHN